MDKQYRCIVPLILYHYTIDNDYTWYYICSAWFLDIIISTCIICLYRGTQSSDCSSPVSGDNPVPLSEGYTNCCADLQGVWRQVQLCGHNDRGSVVSPATPQEIRTAPGLWK